MWLRVIGILEALKTLFPADPGPDVVFTQIQVVVNRRRDSPRGAFEDDLGPSAANLTLSIVTYEPDSGRTAVE
jgi:hypothetical protein